MEQYKSLRHSMMASKLRIKSSSKERKNKIILETDLSRILFVNYIILNIKIIFSIELIKDHYRQRILPELANYYMEAQQPYGLSLD